MKYVGILALLLMLTLLSGCSRDGGNDYDDRAETAHVSNEMPQIQIPDEVIEEVANLEPVLHLSYELNEVSLLDVTTGEQVAVYAFDEDEVVERVWDLGDGYYAAWVGEESLWVLAQRLWLEEGNTGMADVEFDYRNQSEHHFRIVIFDANLTVLDAVPYDEEELMSLFGSVVRFVNGEFFVYGTHLDSNCFLNAACDFQRINVHTAEIETLLEFENSQPLISHGFVGDQQMLVTVSNSSGGPGQTEAPSFSIRYGIFDLETQELQLFEKENFWKLEVIYTDSTMLISGMNTEAGWAMGERRGEVIVFDIASMTSEVIQLGYEGDFTMQFSFDGNDIMIINDTESVVRKYDLNGEIVAEVEAGLPSDLNALNTHIFPLNERIYAIKPDVWWGMALTDDDVYETLDMSPASHALIFVTLP